MRQVAICGRRREPLDDTAKELQAQGAAGVHVGCCDIRDYDQVKSFVLDVQKQLGDVTILINNAGGYAGSALSFSAWIAPSLTHPCC